MPIYGYPILRLVLELVNFVGIMYAWKKYGERESHRLRSEHFFGIMFQKTFWKYAKYYMSIFFGHYSEYLGVEMGTIFTGIYGNLDVTSAFVSFSVFMNATYNVGKGFSMVVRTEFGNLVGEELYKQAKTYAT